MYCKCDGDMFTCHLHGPPSSIALVNQPLVLLTKLLLLPERSQCDQARQRLTELAEDGGQGNGVQPFQLPIGGYIQVLHPEVAKSQRHCYYKNGGGDKQHHC